MNAHDDAPIYELAATELIAGTADRGIYAKAFSAAMADADKARALYIRYRVEQLKVEAIRRIAREARRLDQKTQELRDELRSKSLNRRAYLAELRNEFGFLLETAIPESPIPSDRFVGTRAKLGPSVSLSDVAEALGLLEFRLIDAVRAGLLSGIRETDGEWWICRQERNRAF